MVFPDNHNNRVYNRGYDGYHTSPGQLWECMNTTSCYNAPHQCMVGCNANETYCPFNETNKPAFIDAYVPTHKPTYQCTMSACCTFSMSDYVSAML